MKIAVVVQARTGSTRLPNKVLLAVLGKTLLERMVERVLAATTPFTLVIATTTDDDDDPIADLAARIGVRCFRGHPADLLDRHYRAGLAVGAEAIAKIPSDCPLIDPKVIDRVLGEFLRREGELDFVSNLHPATYPDGNDVEVMPMRVLETAWREATRPLEREHTTPFIWERPERFRLANVRWERELDLSMSHRFTIDYAEDYAFIRAVFEALWNPERPIFTLDDVVLLLERRPEILALNARYAGVNWYRHHLGELRTVGRAETRFEDAS